jgi:hypothetical protein
MEELLSMSAATFQMSDKLMICKALTTRPTYDLYFLSSRIPHKLKIFVLTMPTSLPEKMGWNTLPTIQKVQRLHHGIYNETELVWGQYLI